MFKYLKNENGFTLIEVLFTIIIIGILSVSILSLFTNSSVRQTKASREIVAIYFAQEGVEQILTDKKTKGFGYIKSENYPTQSHNEIERKISITPVNNELKKITVQIVWMNQVDSLVTLVGNY